MPLTTAGLISGWTYPLRGILILSKAPELRSKVSHFLISITATSAATSAAWLWFFYSRHVQFISQLFGMAGGSLLAHFAAGVVVLAESTLPVYLLGAAAVRLLSKYWDRKGVPRDADSRSLVAKQRSGELRSFGLVAGTLGGLPLLNWFLGLSNMVGAALLAADMEKKRGPVFVGHASAPWGAH
ncbi:hypothetical protein OEZ86_009835 [Tetradesmus obliquus]|uniref:Uncharacterized protein n=1 Tax=Tetradesmus obliquus TaxID=3088 RepID=A0ABY8UP46_TETOB|nr:hypothetical protein OEZ85_001273 [Tetradesmus obliquus]WIA43342.1 hypothetical protein OEZ86_009835 [Tetradesmus obliquus]